MYIGDQNIKLNTRYSDTCTALLPTRSLVQLQSYNRSTLLTFIACGFGAKNLFFNFRTESCYATSEKCDTGPSTSSACRILSRQS
ncbi:hypothetical protein L596_026536 [Steinernema carpocapsae]|uniref:Uncharacterized protein n=1 Tax=Steinernema carpocapsae TaxID=34508 RepID=A0A4U5M2M9_STECR|nr:hypothetical protein L596_026536 [Steinernema carpocapsae]